MSSEMLAGESGRERGRSTWMWNGKESDGGKPIVGKRSNLEKGREEERLLNEIGERGAV